MGYTPPPLIPPPVLTEDEKFERELRRMQGTRWGGEVLNFTIMALLLSIPVLLLAWKVA